MATIEICPPIPEAIDLLINNSTIPAHQRLTELQRAMNEIEFSGDNTCHLFVGPWLSSLHKLLEDPTFDVSQLSAEMYRDEYVDNYKYELGYKGFWLRKRFQSAKKRPEYTLKYQVHVGANGSISYRSVFGAADIKEVLPCEFLSVSYPLRIAVFDFLRISYNNNNCICYVDIARIDLKTCYIVATTTKDNPPFAEEPLPLLARSKVAEALFHQNYFHYEKLLQNFFLGPHNTEEMAECHVALEKFPFRQNFYDFASSFNVSLPYDPMEDEPDYEEDDQ